jgi:hypothetical protein
VSVRLILPVKPVTLRRLERSHQPLQRALGWQRVLGRQDAPGCELARVRPVREAPRQRGRSRRNPKAGGSVPISGNKRSRFWMDLSRASPQVPLSVAPHNTYGLLFAVTSGYRDGLCGAAQHIGVFRRRDKRRVSMCPIPRNAICIRIARHWLRTICHGFAIRWPTGGVVPHRRPHAPTVASPVMPARLGERPIGHQMRRTKPSTRRHSRPGGGPVRGKHERYYAEGRDRRPIHFTCHGTYQFVGYRTAPQRTLGRAFSPRKCIINYWLSRNVN